MGNNRKEHAFRITNIDLQDSGNYSCVIRKKREWVDHEKRTVRVKDEDEYDVYNEDFQNKFQNFQPLVTKDNVEEEEVKSEMNETEIELKCGEKRRRKTKGRIL